MHPEVDEAEALLRAAFAFIKPNFRTDASDKVAELAKLKQTETVSCIPPPPPPRHPRQPNLLVSVVSTSDGSCGVHAGPAEGNSFPVWVSMPTPKPYTLNPKSPHP